MTAETRPLQENRDSPPVVMQVPLSWGKNQKKRAFQAVGTSPSGTLPEWVVSAVSVVSVSATLSMRAT